MLFSIIIPVYNVEEYLGRCIESIQMQECKDFEIIIIDDASTDHTLQTAKEAKEKYGNIIIIEQTHAGQATARNRGIAAAKGEYIVFIDGDDYIETGYLNQLQRLIEPSQPDLCVASSYYVVQAGEKTKYSAIDCRENVEYGTPELLFREGKIPGAMWLLTCKRSIILEHQVKFSEKLFCNEDFDFLMNLVIVSQNVSTYSKPYYNYFKDNAVSTYARISGEKIYSYMSAYRKWFDYFTEHRLDFDYSENVRSAISKNYRWSYNQLINLPVRDPYFKKDILFLQETKYMLGSVLYMGNISFGVYVEKVKRKIHRVGHALKLKLKGNNGK